jgi:hypothetical protein
MPTPGDGALDGSALAAAPLAAGTTAAAAPTPAPTPTPPPPPPTPPPAPPSLPSARERDIRLAIGEALVASGGVDEDAVQYRPLLEGAADGPILVTIEPTSTALAAAAGMSSGAPSNRAAYGFDAPLAGQLLYTGQATVGVQGFDPDPQARDEAMELVLCYLANAINGRSLAGITFPADTLVSQWKWQDATSTKPRALLITVRYTFMLDGWEGFDTTP